MRDKIKVNLDKYELGILINALMDFRNKSLKERIDTESIDNLYIKFLNCYEKFYSDSILCFKKDNVR